MRVGSKGRYAVIALVDVAENAGARPVALAEVAERQHISLSYLEQLFAMLRRSGLVISSRGPGGGYRLGRAAGDITVGEVFRAVEETGNGHEGGRDWTSGGGVTASLWTALDDQIREFLEGVSVADVVAGKVNGALANGAVRQADSGLSAPSKLA
jgi:Rrf2 family iron-sulfur cluster assembly transcriptional regulator